MNPLELIARAISGRVDRPCRACHQHARLRMGLCEGCIDLYTERRLAARRDAEDKKHGRD